MKEKKLNASFRELPERCEAAGQQSIPLRSIK